MNKLKIGITHGYTNGVSYEVILKAFEDPTILELCTPIVYGSPKLATYHRKALELSTNFTTIQNVAEAVEGKLNILECFTEEIKVELRTKTTEADKALKVSIEKAKTDFNNSLFDILVSAPCDGHECEGLAIYINPIIRIASVTDNQPITAAAKQLTTDLILKKLRTFSNCLKRDFMLTRPRIALLTLNPTPGTEEEEIIAPAIETATEERICAFGPYTANKFFSANDYTHYDGILAMYHEQATTPFNLLTSDYAVVHFAEEEKVHTTTLEGAELEIAGKGIASPISFVNAIYTAIDIYRNRINFDDSQSNPLPKLFQDKRDDNRKGNNIE